MILHTLLTFPGNELSDHFYAQLQAASQREFHLPLSAKSNLSDHLYFLLIETKTQYLLASAYLKPIHPVLCGDLIFSFLNIGGVIANEKGRGYGKQIMSAIKAYLLTIDNIGLGFCSPRNQGFYEKCGFTVDTLSTSKFIYQDGNEAKTAAGQYVLYLDSHDGYMQNILLHDQAIFVPDPTIW